MTVWQALTFFYEAKYGLCLADFQFALAKICLSSILLISFITTNPSAQKPFFKRKGNLHEIRRKLDLFIGPPPPFGICHRSKQESVTLSEIPTQKFHSLQTFSTG